MSHKPIWNWLKGLYSEKFHVSDFYLIRYIVSDLQNIDNAVEIFSKF